MKRRPSRNDLCSCGSGRKYKNCCAGKSRMLGPKLLGAPLWAVVAVVGVAVAAFVMIRADRRTETAPASTPVEERPAPWTYDSLTNRHFDPGHGHWHDGRPPASAAGPAATTGSQAPPTAASPPTATPPPAPTAPPTTVTPQPWTYDSEKNQHWDPNHQHWHPGLPPAGR
jgi:hypothetical protein